jgi:hypothetical protein
MASKEFLSVPEFVKSVHYMLGGPGTLDPSASWVDENGDPIDYAKKGTVLGKATETGLLVPYNDSGSGGEDVAVGILWEDISFGENGENASAVYMIHGRVDENQLIGIDANAKGDLKHIVFESAKVGAVPLWSTLSGTITNAAGGAAISGAVITITLPDGSSASGTTDTDGKYKIENLPYGTLAYLVEAAGFNDVTGTVEIGYNEEITLDVEMTASGG